MPTDLTRIAKPIASQQVEQIDADDYYCYYRADTTSPWEVEAEAAQEEYALEEIRRNELLSAELLCSQPFGGQTFLIGPDLFPKHGKMLLTGVAGAGKSAMTLHIAACLASKTPLFNLTHKHKGPEYGEPVFPVTETSTVLYIDYELPHEIRAHKRLKPLSKSFEKKFGHKLFFPPHPSRYRLHNLAGETLGKGSFDKLDRLVAATRPDVLVIDPLSSSHTVDENSIALKQPLNNADRLIDEYGCAILIVHHASVKSARDASGQKVEKETAAQPRGHTCLIDWADVHVHLTEIPVAGYANKEVREESRRILQLDFGKTRHCRKPWKRRLCVDFATMQIVQD